MSFAFWKKSSSLPNPPARGKKKGSGGKVSDNAGGRGSPPTSDQEESVQKFGRPRRSESVSVKKSLEERQQQDSPVVPQKEAQRGWAHQQPQHGERRQPLPHHVELNGIAKLDYRDGLGLGLGSAQAQTQAQAQGPSTTSTAFPSAYEKQALTRTTELQKQIQQLIADAKVKESEIERLKTSMQEMEGENGKAREALRGEFEADFEREKKVLEEKVSEAVDNKEKVEKKYKELKKHTTSVISRLEAEQGEGHRLRTESEGMQKSIDVLKSENYALKIDFLGEQDAGRHLQRMRENDVKEMERMRKMVGGLQEQLRICEDDRQRRAAALEEQTSEVEALRAEIGGLYLQVETERITRGQKANVSIPSIPGSLGLEGDRDVDMDVDAGARSKQSQEEKMELERLRQAYDDRLREVVQLQDENTTLRRSNENNQKEVNGLREEITGLRYQLQQAERKNKHTGPRGGAGREDAAEAARLRAEVADLQRRLNAQTPTQQKAPNTPPDASRELEKWRADALRLQKQLESEQSGRMRLQRMHEDRLRETSRLREESKNLQRQVEMDHRKEAERTAEAARIREETNAAQRKVESERNERMRLQRAYDDSKREVYRLREESTSLRAFLNQADIVSAADIVSVLNDLNQKIGHFANTLSEEWDTSNNAGPSSNLPGSMVTMDASAGATAEQMDLVQNAIGTEFLDLLGRRRGSGGPRDDRDATLVLFALQACAVHCVLPVFTDFCFGFSYEENGILGKLYEQMCKTESQALSYRWRALGHFYGRSAVPDYASSLHQRTSEALIKHFAAMHAFVGGNTATDATIGEEFEAELTDISATTLRLVIMVKEQLMSANTEVYVAPPDFPFDANTMEDVLASGMTGESMMCTVEMGLLQIARSQQRKGQSEARTLVKSKVISAASLHQFLEN